MNFFRLVSTTALPAALLTFVVVACSSGTTTTGSSSGTSGASGGTSGTSGGTSGTSGGTSGSSGSSGFKDCSTSSSKCTEAEAKPYSDCLETKCGDKIKVAFGPDYKSGTFAGACKEYITCTQACNCNDSACSSKCIPDGGFPKACTDALTDYGTCISTAGCEVPACAKTDGG